MIDPDDSVNFSERQKLDKKHKGKKFLEISGSKKQEEKLGERMEKLYGPEDSKIKSILSKKVAEKMIKSKIKTDIFKKAIDIKR